MGAKIPAGPWPKKPLSCRAPILPNLSDGAISQPGHSRGQEDGHALCPGLSLANRRWLGRGELPREFPIVTVFFLCIFLPVIISAPTASSLPATLSPDVSFKGELQSFV